MICTTLPPSRSQCRPCPSNPSSVQHFLDWVLLRDAVRTLSKSIAHIRLKRRLPKAPLAFLGDMNQLCIRISASSRSIDRKKLMKKTLRKMKHLLKRVANHARSHLDALRAGLAATDLSKAQVIIKGMENILNQLPAIIHQAHERIIGSRKMANDDKILSLYDPEVRVILRRKAGAAVEFGNILWLGENYVGLIVDYQLLKSNPTDPKLLKDSLARLTGTMNLPVKSVHTDRGPATK